MTKMQRIRMFLRSILTLLAAILMICFPEFGVGVVVFVLTVALIVNGIHNLIYYFTMARHMVDGQYVLIKGVLILNFGLLLLTLNEIPLQYIMIYLCFFNGFRGATGLLQSLQSRSMQVKTWKYTFLLSLIDLALAVLALIYIGSQHTMVYIYSISLIFSSFAGIFKSTRQTTMVYIQ